MISVIATRYAHALVDVVTAPESGLDPKLVGDQLGSIAGAMISSPELRSVLMSPAVPKTKKKAVIGRVADQMELPKKVRNFLLLTVDRGRIAKLPEIREAFDLALDDKLGFVRADIASAEDLTADQRTRLESQLSQLAGKTVKATYSVDRSLVGGAIARVGSTVYDGSIRGQLENLRKQLIVSSGA
jgi:F-type H+-transporting ATPase subunit delta